MGGWHSVTVLMQTLYDSISTSWTGWAVCAEQATVRLNILLSCTFIVPHLRLFIPVEKSQH